MENLGDIIIETSRSLGKSNNSMGDTLVEIANQSRKLHIIEGTENIGQKGRFIFVLNHFVTDTYLPLEQKWTQTLELMGVVTQEMKRILDPNKKVIWLVAAKPRSALSKRNGEEIVLPTDNLRLKFLTQARDVIPVSYTLSGARMVLEESARNLEAGNVIGIFPEERTGLELGQAKDGFAHIAIRNNTPVYPIAVYSDEESINVKIGNLHYPSPNITDKHEFALEVMKSLASMLPVRYRGHYQETV